MGRRRGSRNGPRGLFGTPGDVLFRGIGATREEQAQFETHMQLVYSGVAAVVGALAAVMLVGLWLGYAGTTIAAIMAGSCAFVIVAERVQRPLI